MTRAAIKHAEEALRTAMLSGDVESLDRLLDDDLLFVAPNGELARKSDDLDNYRSGNQSIHKHVPRDLVIALHGDDVAVSSVVVELAGQIRGEAFEATVRYTRTWRRGSSGRWRIIGGAVAGVAPTGNDAS